MLLVKMSVFGKLQVMSCVACKDVNVGKVKSNYAATKDVSIGKVQVMRHVSTRDVSIGKVRVM